MTRETLFFDDLGQFGHATALVLETGRVVSYRALATSSAELASRLAERQLTFLLAENSAESLLGYVAAMSRRVPAALLPAAMNKSLLANLFAVYQPSYVWLPQNRSELVSGGTEVFRFGHYVLIDTGIAPCQVHPDLALLTTTSGSTGSPKFVRQGYRNIAANTKSICKYLNIQSTDRAITSLPMNYVFGLSVINTHLASGASLVLTDRGLMEKEFWSLLKQHQVTSLSGVPYTYQMLKQLRFSQMNLPSLKVITQAGGKLPVDLGREFAAACRAKNIKFFIMYGAAEATARMSYLPPEHNLEKADSIGVAVPGGSFSLIDEQGHTIVDNGVPGELVYRGENVTMGYAVSCEDLARGDDRGGVLHTGDIAHRDADGFYYIVGRKSRFIKIFGNRVSLEDIEHYLKRLGIDSACAGQDDKLRIFVTREADGPAASTAVQEMTGLHHLAFSVTIIDEIPRNEVGKIVYSELPQGN